MPKLSGVIETALYVDDLDRARAFYEEVLGLEALTADPRFAAFDVGGRSVLLLFRRGSVPETIRLPGGTIPPHDGSGPIHMAFAIPVAELPLWEKTLGEHDVAIEGRTDWPRGGKSIYFRDPDNHLLELATPGIWKIY
ncbi:VOC family protein [Bradyrhizobium sp. LMTR 3]|uniref:VOC family protein n=1 Tax=Bradyrhizobium sp. LMTR 3 TaxID=189873 RepID=UPI0008108BF3|nr:VOC family protein [Bradyrhizobium sp. LMTR 3]OCK59377.1 glyoxalase [Bradyrhizobium sp. LMTR 3]